MSVSFPTQYVNDDRSFDDWRPVQLDRWKRVSRQASSGTTMRIASIDSGCPWLLASIKDVDRLQLLPVTWSSSGVARPNAVAIESAKSIVECLAEIDLRPSHIDPSTDEGVCISFQKDDRYADIECFNTGDIFAAVTSDATDTDVWQVVGGSLKETIGRIRRFIAG